MFRRRRLGRLVAQCLMLVVAPAVARAGYNQEIAASQRALIIYEAYEKLVRLAADGGAHIDFEISDVRTIEAKELASVRWVDLMTMPGGQMIDMTRDTTQIDGEIAIVAYRPSWNTGPDYLETPPGVKLIDMSTSEVLREIAKEHAAAASVIAISSFAVDVRYGERSREYRAAALWFPAIRGRDATVLFIDNITQGVDRAIREKPVARRSERPSGATKSGTCVAREDTTPSSGEERGTDDHWGGGAHLSRAYVDFVCRYNSDCSGSCTPNWVVQRCDDAVWDTWQCHVMASDSGRHVGTTNDARTQATSCAAGWGCIEKQCYACGACSIAVGVNIYGLSVNFTPSGEPDWQQGNLRFTHQCGLAEEVPPPPDDGGPGDAPPEELQQELPAGSSGGGGGYGNCCTWQRNESSGCTSGGTSGRCTVWYTCLKWGC